MNQKVAPFKLLTISYQTHCLRLSKNGFINALIISTHNYQKMLISGLCTSLFDLAQTKPPVPACAWPRVPGAGGYVLVRTGGPNRKCRCHPPYPSLPVSAARGRASGGGDAAGPCRARNGTRHHSCCGPKMAGSGAKVSKYSSAEHIPVVTVQPCAQGVCRDKQLQKQISPWWQCAAAAIVIGLCCPGDM